MARFLTVLVLLVGLLACPALAKPRLRSAGVDAQGRAKIEVSQRQIFDEVGGKGTLGMDVARGLAVLLTRLTLPEEAGDVGGNGYVDMTGESMSAVGNFTYVPVNRKQIKLDVDYRAVSDANSASGSHSIQMDYPLPSGAVPSASRDYLTRTSFDVVGHGWWNHYTEGGVKLAVEIHDPTYNARQDSDINQLHVQVADHAADTSFIIHFDVRQGGQTARFLQADPRRIEASLRGIFHALNMHPSSIQIGNLHADQKSVQADLQIDINQLRGSIVDLVDQGFRYARPPRGFPARAVVGALSRLIALRFAKMDVMVFQKGDHFELDIDAVATEVDRSILGYLSMMEVLQPALVEAGTKNPGLSVLDKQVTAAQTSHFKQILIAAGESHDNGDCDYDFKVRFPTGRLVLTSRFVYKGTITAYNQAATLLGFSPMHQEYSLLKLRTTHKGLEGHGFAEAQGPWFASQLALYAEAAKQNKEYQPLVAANGTLKLREGRLAVDLKKSLVASQGWLQFADSQSVVHDVFHQVPSRGDMDLQAVQLQYDAHKWPGHILIGEYVQGKSTDAVRKAIQSEYGKAAKIGTEKSVELPKLDLPTVDIPKTLDAQRVADRDALGVRPWVAPIPPPPPPPPPTSYKFVILSAIVVALFVVGIAGIFLVSRPRRVRPELDDF